MAKTTHAQADINDLVVIYKSGAAEAVWLDATEFRVLLDALGVPIDEVAISHKAMVEVMTRHELCSQPIDYELLDDEPGRSLRSVVFLNVDAQTLHDMNRELDTILSERLGDAHPWAYIATFERNRQESRR